MSAVHPEVVVDTRKWLLSRTVYNAALCSSLPIVLIACVASRPMPRSDTPTYAGCSMYTPADAFNADVTSAPVDSHSVERVSSVAAAGDTTGFYLASGVQSVNVATLSTPTVTVTPKVSWHAKDFAGIAWPYERGFLFEAVPPNTTGGSGDSDLLTIVKTGSKCIGYEMYGGVVREGVLWGFSGRVDDYSRRYKLFTGTGGSSGSGLPHIPLHVKWEEMAAGRISHALYLTAWQNAVCNCYVAPANMTDGVAYNGPARTKYRLAYGSRLRLKPSFDDSRFGPQARAITAALKHYGGFLADTGSRYANSNAIEANDTTGVPSHWDATDLRALSSITYRDFDVLRLDH